MEDADRDVYAGFYQGLAWAQGAKGGALEVGVPDELWKASIRDDTGSWYFKFDLVNFFEMVADADDAGIHYWDVSKDAKVMVLHCTEDEVPEEGDWVDTALTAHGWLKLYEMTLEETR